MSTGDLSIQMGLTADALTCVMLLVITGVGSAIHLYSYGYMHGDKGFARFFAYLNLFTFAMLLLVLADNLLLMFVGWEGVGLCSYLLIGFWFEDLANADAGRKAFVVNRVGDFAFLLGLFTLFSLAGTLNVAGLEAAVGGLDLAALLTDGPLAGWTTLGALGFAAVCLFVGATGKSAQIPLYTWLPDAMAGPTPVSALIHAATMVTAGIYMIARLDFLFVLLPGVLMVMGLVAASTAALAGVIALAQNDIKKVLAYSTISQLGYMFCAMAASIFTAGIFHLVSHAFFKALLFLGAGAIIHALDGEQDIRKMGGLRKDMKGVFILFTIGAVALAGVPPFVGFFSKDQVLGAVHLQMSQFGGLWTVTWWLLVVTTLMTALYTTRLVLLTFFGPPADEHRHPHATHWTIMVALGLLAALSVVGGVLGAPLEEFTHGWAEPAWLQAMGHGHEMEHSHHVAMMTSVTAVTIGIGLGVLLYAVKRSLVENFVTGVGKPLHRLVENKFYVDELYDMLFVRPVSKGAVALWKSVDRLIIDAGLVEGSAKGVYAVATVLRTSQSGVVNVAVAVMLLGTVVVLGVLTWGG
jgi:NADH-quinone oxidoreductase subunit L